VRPDVGLEVVGVQDASVKLAPSASNLRRSREVMRTKLRDKGKSCQDVAIMPKPISDVIASKIDEDAGLIAGLISLIPHSQMDWRPDWPHDPTKPPFSALELATHLVESFAAIPACLKKLHPEVLAHFEQPMTQPAVASILASLETSRARAVEGFSLTADEDLTRDIPTYFSPLGEPFLETLWANLKHLQHHTYQLFIYLKLMGLPVTTANLHKFKSTVPHQTTVG